MAQLNTLKNISLQLTRYGSVQLGRLVSYITEIITIIAEVISEYFT